MDVYGFSQFGQDLFIDRRQKDAADAPLRRFPNTGIEILLHNSGMVDPSIWRCLANSAALNLPPEWRTIIRRGTR
jgi:hypothetical protein